MFKPLFTKLILLSQLLMCRDSLLQDGRNKFFFSDIEERSHARHFSVLFIYLAVLRTRDVYPGSDFFHPGSRVKKIPWSGSASASKNLSVLTQKLFPCSRKYDPRRSSRIRILDPNLDFLPIPDPGSRGQKGTGSRIRIPNTAYFNLLWFAFLFAFSMSCFLCISCTSVKTL